MKKSDILAPLIIAEADSWLLIWILKDIHFNLLNFLDRLKANYLFSSLNFFLKFLPLILPFLALLLIFGGLLVQNKFKGIFQFLKFSLTGSLNTLIDFAFLNFLMEISQISVGPYYSLFKAISFSLATFNSYFWNKLWTFRQRETKIGPKEFSKFYSVTGAGFLVNVIVASFIVNIVGPQFGFSSIVWANIGAFLAVLCVAAWNFAGFKFVVFKK